MNVKELRDALENLPDDMQVILQKDSEGNGFSPLQGADSEVIYVEHSSWSGDIFDCRWSACDADMDNEEWEKFKEQPRSLVLYPIN